MKISITRYHIDHGHKCDSGSCPVALAIQELLPTKKFDVYKTYVDFGDQFGMNECVDLPNKARTFIREFDNPDQDPKWLEPLDFELDYEPEEA